uniref:Putative secreted protein n=1 Tax=Anopheles marajoara TaxID=58244 RepID=A0A2M4CAQ1_9DIPT
MCVERCSFICFRFFVARCWLLEMRCERVEGVKIASRDVTYTLESVASYSASDHAFPFRLIRLSWSAAYKCVFLCRALWPERSVG